MSIHLNNPSPAGASGGTGGTSDHAALSNLDYPSAAHTGFEPTISTGATGEFYQYDKTWATPSTGGAGSSTDHAALVNLDYANAAHTGFFPSVTTGKVSVSAPMNTDSTRQVLGGALSISMTTSSATSDGYLTKEDWASFSTRLNSITTGKLSASAPMNTDSTRYLLGGALVVSMTTSSATSDGYLTSTDWASFNTRLNSITTGTVGVLLPLTTDTTRYVLGGALQLSLNTATIWATTFSGLNVYATNQSGSTMWATTFSGTTVLATTHSGSNFYGTTVSAGTVYSTTCSATTLTATTTTATNSYATTFWATTYSGTTVLATTLSGTTARVSTNNAIYSTITTSLVIPVATNSTLTLAGQILVDSHTTTGSTFKFYSDAQYVLPAYYTKSFCIATPAGAATYSVWRVPYNVTIQKAYALVVAGASTSLTGALYEGDGNGATLVTSTTSVVIPANTTSALTVANGTLDAGDWLVWVTTATSGGIVNQLAVTFDYTADAS